jgi:hypothetical protein
VKMTKTSNRCFIKGSRVLTRSTEARDQRDASHARPPPTTPSKPLLHKRIRGKSRAYTPDMLVQGERCFIKRLAPRQRAEKSGTHAKTIATGKPAAGR